MSFFAQIGEVVAALNATFLVEAAQAVADQKKTKGHGSASGRGHRMEAAFRGDNRGQLKPAGAQFPTTGFPALEGTSGGLVPRFGRFHLVVGLDGQPLATFGGTGDAGTSFLIFRDPAAPPSQGFPADVLEAENGHEAEPAKQALYVLNEGCGVEGRQAQKSRTASKSASPPQWAPRGRVAPCRQMDNDDRKGCGLSGFRQRRRGQGEDGTA